MSITQDSSKVWVSLFAAHHVSSLFFERRVPFIIPNADDPRRRGDQVPVHALAGHEEPVCEGPSHVVVPHEEAACSKHQSLGLNRPANQ